tara:strand:+ start:944 stop:1381 length:438 start_codon:yes stop_codon:yes gene_type:complete
MPLFQVSTLNKYGNLRSRVIYNESSQFTINPKGFGPFIGVKSFKYDYTHSHRPPFLVKTNGKKYLLPDWKEVDPQTTLEDINWIKPTIPTKPEPKVEPNLFKFKSSSSDSIYTVRKIMDTYKCSCPGYWRSKTRECKHIKEIKSK